MLTEINVAGIYLAPLAPYALVSLLLLLALRFTLRRVGLFQWIWHPALFEMGLYISILSILILTFPV